MVFDKAKNKFSICYPTKIENTFNLCENNFLSNFCRYVDRIIIYLHLYQKPPAPNFKKENKVSIFTFFECFLILYLASHDVEKYS